MKFEKTEVWGFEHALRGLRNPMNSWEKSDSGYCYFDDYIDCPNCILSDRCGTCLTDIGGFVIGENDLKLAQKLILAGAEHRKFLRQIMISVDITAPLYWFKEFDTYKIGTTANSTSSMHKLASTPITIDCFETGDYCGDLCNYIEEFPEHEISQCWNGLINNLEVLRLAYVRTKDKRFWKELIRLLPESWLQTRTVTMNYENVLNMEKQRRNHKLTEWSVDFMNWVKTLPYAKELILLEV